MLALLTGEDAWAVEQALHEFATRLAADGSAPETWRRSGAEVDLGELGDRLATQPLFGGGTLAVIEDPGPLFRSAASRDALDVAVTRLAPGNGLVFVALDDASTRRAAWVEMLRDLVARHAGSVTSFRALTRERMGSFIRERASAIGVQIDPRAADLLGERVGAAVRESDVDRRFQAQSAVAELEKLALYRPGGRIVEDDVRVLVAEAVPGSAWAFLDAVGARRLPEAAKLLERLISDGTPLPVLVVQLHRRVRSLIEVREHLAAGEPAEALPRALKMKPFPAQKLAEQAGTWTLEELEAALDALFELDVAIKGLENAAASDAEAVLGLELWLAERVGRG